MIVQPLTWDTEFFGFSVGSLEVPSTAGLDDVSEILKSCEFDVIYVQVENPTPDQLDHYSKLAPLADRKIVYEKAIPAEAVDLNEPIRPYENGITDALVELAWESGLHSRFYWDPQFRPHYRRFYRTWLTKSIDGDLADVIFVSALDDTQVGFVSVAIKGSVGQIGLLAVASDYRRQGIAGILLQNVQAWCQRAELKRVRVVTQERNAGACRTYERHGFQIAKTVGIYHYWKSQPGGDASINQSK